MTYTDQDKEQMKRISELSPAFKEFAHEVMNSLTAAKLALCILENPETPVQAEMLRARALEAIDRSVETFREVL